MFASVTIDLDGIDCYHRIHGLDPPSAADPVYDVALGRFLELVQDLEIRATLFVIGADLEREAVAARVADAASAGHEIASHSYDHPYDLGRLDAIQVASQLDRAAEIIERVAGRRPVGFRAPGYGVSRTVIEVLSDRGYRYDSSVLPCPPYYLAKAAVMLRMWMARRPSGSTLTSPRTLFAPLQPYQPDPKRFERPARTNHAAGGLWEIPMWVAPVIRVPIIGTSLALFGSRRFRAIYPWVRRTHSFVNLEFHAIDFLDASDPGISAELRDRQPDLRRSLADKWRHFRDVLRLMKEDYEFGTLEQMVGRLDSR